GGRRRIQRANGLPPRPLQLRAIDVPAARGHGEGGARGASRHGRALVPHVRAFIAGFASTLVFHQGVLTLFWLSGVFPRAPYDMAPAPPLGVPAVISLACWGGVWGMAIWPLLRNGAGRTYWFRALLIGAVLPSAVALFIVFPLKAMPVAGGWDPRIIIRALILNGAWGLGVALFGPSGARRRRPGT